MEIQDNKTPVLVLGCKLGALAIMRSLGGEGVNLFGVDESSTSPGMLSRYCSKKFLKEFNEINPDEYLEHLVRIGTELAGKAILIPTSDELSEFVYDNQRSLDEFFIFPRNDAVLVKNLASKKGMYSLAMAHGVPVPYTLFPDCFDDVLRAKNEIEYPVMLKGIYGNRLQMKTGKKMVIVNSEKELLDSYREMEDPDNPNLMIQELIPGGDDQVYIFDGYFNEKSECLAAFTGYKVRQFPIHVGCASLGECRWYQEVADITIQFMKNIGYRGIIDIGYRLDPRDGRYKILDINPRIGQAFRLFVGEDDMDVARALYLDLTGQKMSSIVPREGRRWVIEDFDIISSLHYYQEGTLGFVEWLQSFKRLEECAWFSWRDPIPFLQMLMALLKRTVVWLSHKIGIYKVRKPKFPGKSGI